MLKIHGKHFSNDVTINPSNYTSVFPSKQHSWLFAASKKKTENSPGVLLPVSQAAAKLALVERFARPSGAPGD